MENNLADLLAVLPESAQYVLIVCTDQEFKLVGLRRIAALAKNQTRLSRLSIFQMDMRTTCEAGAAAAVAPQPSQPKAAPRAIKSKKGASSDPPKPRPASGSKQLHEVAPTPPDPSQPPQLGASAISTGLYPALRRPIRPQLPAPPSSRCFITGHRPPCAGYRRVF